MEEKEFVQRNSAKQHSWSTAVCDLFVVTTLMISYKAILFPLAVCLAICLPLTVEEPFIPFGSWIVLNQHRNTARQQKVLVDQVTAVRELLSVNTQKFMAHLLFE